MTTEATSGAPAATGATGTPAEALPGNTPNELPAGTPATGEQPPQGALEIADTAAAQPVPEAGQVFTYNPSGDPGLDLALDFVGNLGFGPEHAAIRAAEAGDFKPLEDALKALGDKSKGWEKLLAAGKAGFERIDTQGKERAAKTTAAIHDIVGGPEQWSRIQKWAGENATADERAAVNAGLKAGGMVARAIARELAGLYMKQPHAEKAGAAARTASAAVPMAPGSNALSPREYTAEVAKLSAKLGNRMDGSPEYKALQARRAAYRGR